MLKHSGFYPITPVLYQSFTWERALRAVVRNPLVSRVLSRWMRMLLPAQLFAAATLCCVAEKMTAM